MDLVGQKTPQYILSIKNFFFFKSCTIQALLFNHSCQRKGVWLLHNNLPVHTNAVAKVAKKKCGFTEIFHSSHSLDLAPSDYYLFTKFKSEFGGGGGCSEAHFKTTDKKYFLRVYRNAFKEMYEVY